MINKIVAVIVAWLKVHWAELIVELVLLALLIFIGWIIWRRHGETIVRRVTEIWQRITRVPEIQRNTLVDIWREFKRGIPFKLRPAVRRYPLFVVIGDHRSGKTSLINNCGHLDVQEMRFHGRVDADALMQVYLGNNEITLEISSNFLYSTSQDHADALLALWAQLPVDTTVIFTIDAQNLLGPDVDQRNRIINALTSKLALFQEVTERPVPLRIALTHMDQVRGFPEYYAFAANSGLDVHVELQPGEIVASFAKGLDHYLGYSRNFLLGLSSRDFIESMEFLGGAREVLGTLNQILVDALERHEFTSCNLNSVCLVSDQSRELQNGLQSNDPFNNSGPRFSFFDALSKRHMRRVKILGAVGSLLMLGNYFNERFAIEHAADLVRSIPAMTVEQYAAEAHPHFTELQSAGKKPGNHWLGIGARFYPEQAETVGQALASGIRSHFLLPRLRLAQTQPQAYSMSVRWLALLHANGSNELGAFFVDPKSQTGLQLPHEMIKDYVTWNTDLNDPQLLALASDDYGVQPGLDQQDMPLPRLAEALEFAGRDTYISQEELEAIQNAARDLQIIINNARVFPEIDEQIMWLKQNGHISPNTLQFWQNSPSEGQLQSTGLRDTLTLITSSRVQRHEQPQNISQVFALIQKMMADYKDDISKNTLGTVGTSIDGHYYSFDSNRWYNLMLRSQVISVLNSFYKRNYGSHGWIFFDPQAQPYRIPLGISTDSSGVLINNAQVDTRLTRESFEQRVKPAILLLSTLIGDMPIQNEDKQVLIDFFVQNLTVYAGNYADAYWSFFKNMTIRINTPDNLHLYLKELQRPGSAFVQNLIRVKENVLLDIPSDPNFQPVRDRLADFQFMQKLMQEQSGSYPQLQRYLAISGEMLDQLNLDGALPPPASTEKADPDAGLKSILTPMGRISYDMLLGNPGSHMRQVEVFLREMNVPASWQGPFLAPFQRVRDFGRQEVNNSINTQWRALWDTQVVPILDGFPFENQRTGVINDSSIDAIQAVFHPMNGSFWAGIRSSFGALFSIVEGRWVPRPEVSRNFNLPHDMQRRLDSTSALTLALWNKDGANQPLAFKVKPELLPEVTFINEDGHEVPLPSLTFLRSASASVLGFNQRRVWQDFSYEWWQKGTVNSGIEFVSQTEKVKKFASVDVDESRWSFYRLLMMAERGPNNQYTWTVIHPERSDKKLKVSFSFKRDPFELFTALKQR